MDIEELDPESSLALAVVDEGSAASSSSEFLYLGQQLESLRSIIQAFDEVDTGSVTPAAPPPIPSWGPFVLKEEIGRGGFGIVCRAFDPATAREIAVKLYRKSDLPAEPRLLGQVRHPNVVSIFGAAVHDGKAGIWMELVRGRTLAERVQAEGPVLPSEAVRIGGDLCSALAAVHAAGLVHQDIKPRNVMEGPEGRVVLMDFGAGLLQGGDEDPAVKRFSGTPLYMAPEVLLGARPSALSDVYSLGVLLFYLLTGTYPVYAASLQELKSLHERPMDRSVRRFASSLRQLRPEVSERLAECVARALVPSEDRYRTPAELATALRSVGVRVRGRWTFVRWLTMAAALAVAVGLVGLSGRRAGHSTPMRTPEATALPAAGLTEALPRVVATPAAAPPVEAVANEAYEVDAGVVVREPGGDRRLGPGDAIAVGDQLVLSFSSSRPLHVYVISQDDKGQARQLFPLSDCRPANPLPAGRHTLPGHCGGEETSWVVTKAGGREHFLVLASPTRLKQVEQLLASLSTPSWTGSGSRREVGGRVASAPEVPGPIGFREIEQIAQAEAAPRRRVRGAWFKEIVVENPAP